MSMVRICLTVLISSQGSMADVPKDLLEQINELERLFTVDKTKLKEITEHFVSELTRGMDRADMVQAL